MNVKINVVRKRIDYNKPAHQNSGKVQAKICCMSSFARAICPLPDYVSDRILEVRGAPVLGFAATINHTIAAVAGWLVASWRRTWCRTRCWTWESCQLRHVQVSRADSAITAIVRDRSPTATPFTFWTVVSAS